MLAHLWPTFGLTLSTSRLVLQLPSDAQLEDLACLAAEGVHGPDERAFLTPWAEGTPQERAFRTPRALVPAPPGRQRTGNWGSACSFTPGNQSESRPCELAASG